MYDGHSHPPSRFRIHTRTIIDVEERSVIIHDGHRFQGRFCDGPAFVQDAGPLILPETLTVARTYLWEHSSLKNVGKLQAMYRDPKGRTMPQLVQSWPKTCRQVPERQVVYVFLGFRVQV